MISKNLCKTFRGKWKLIYLSLSCSSWWLSLQRKRISFGILAWNFQAVMSQPLGGDIVEWILHSRWLDMPLPALGVYDLFCVNLWLIRNWRMSAEWIILDSKSYCHRKPVDFHWKVEFHVFTGFTLEENYNCCKLVRWHFCSLL